MFAAVAQASVGEDGVKLVEMLLQETDIKLNETGKNKDTPVMLAMKLLFTTHYFMRVYTKKM